MKNVSVKNVDRDAVLAALGHARGDGMTLEELAQGLGVPERDRPRLRSTLYALVRKGAILRVGRGTYALGEAAQDRYVGRISVHPAGYGFVVVEDGSDDVFVPAKYRGAALDGDRVELATWEGYKGTEGRVVAVLSRGRAKLTGLLMQEGRTSYLQPDDPRIAAAYGRVTLEAGTGGGKVGQSALVEISEYPSDRHPGIKGQVVRVLGDPEDPRTEIEKIIACGAIPDQFPDEAAAQAAAVAQVVAAEDFADRIDLRDRPFITIDPESARDFDDAVCIERGPHGGPRVWVAVADVSHYVKPNDALDREALVRGVSVYLPDRAIPMLPFELSSGICSLNPDVDRCAMVVRLDFDDEGMLKGRQFAAAVIRSRARLDYHGVAAALQGDFRGRWERNREWAGPLQELDRLARRLRRRRMARGALDLDLPEAQVILDDDDPRLVRDVIRAKGLQDVRRAYQLVEEFMISANEAVGSFFRERDLPCIWRVHAPPKRARLEELAAVLHSYGVRMDVDGAQTCKGMGKVLEALRNRSAGRALTFLLLRALKQAVYQTDNVGHFGLASAEYVHFTSPIRRYPDLLVHRLLKHHLHREGQASGGGASLAPPSTERLGEIAQLSSGHERRAMEAEREAVAMYRAYLMRDSIGDEFRGRISAVTTFGAFVELEDPFVEGLIRLESLGDDHFELAPQAARLHGVRTGLTLALGDDVDVELISASMALRRIDFRLLRGGRARARDKRRRGGPSPPRKRPAPSHKREAQRRRRPQRHGRRK